MKYQPPSRVQINSGHFTVVSKLVTELILVTVMNVGSESFILSYTI